MHVDLISLQTNRTINGKPVYSRVGNSNMHLSFINVSNYPAPWKMWAGDSYPSNSHFGNIKIGPKNLECPENTLVNVTRERIL